MIISNVSISANSFAIGETGTITFTVKNNSGWTARTIEAKLARVPQHASSEIVSVLPETSISLANNASKTYTRTFIVTSAIQGSLDYYGERAFVANLRITLTDGGGFNGQADLEYVSTGAYLIDFHYTPSIPVFTVERSPAADSTGAAVDIACTLATGADPAYSGLALALQWKEEDVETFPTANALAVTVADALAAGGTTVTPSFTFETGKAYTLRATFTDGIDSAFSEIKLSKAQKVLNVHPTSKNIGLGQFAVADLDADDVKRLDMTYRPYFHEGIGAIGGNGLAGLGLQGGAVGSIGDVAPGSYASERIDFPVPFAADTIPVVVACFLSSSTAGTFGRCCVSVRDIDNEGFSLRCFNGDTATRTPNYQWIALGVPATT